MHIIFKRCRWKNILSTGAEFSEVDFIASPTTLIMGPNGAGKSTIYQALTFGIFGRPFSKFDGKTSIINWHNGSDALTETEFSVNGVEHMIRRGMKPNILEVYESGIKMDSPPSMIDFQRYIEEHVVKMDFRTFSQIVVLGSTEYVPFFRLSTPDRRLIVENILGLGIFSDMNGIVKGQLGQCELELGTVTSDMQLAKQRITMKDAAIRRIKEAAAHTNGADERKRLAEAEVLKYQQLAAEAQTRLAAHPWDSQDERDLRELQRKVGEITELGIKLQAKLEEISRNAAFFANNDHCPTCDQDITPAIKAAKIQKYRETKTTLGDGMVKLNKTKQQCQHHMTDLADRKAIRDQMWQQSTAAFEQLRACQAFLDRLHQIQPSQEPDVSADLKELEEFKTDLERLGLLIRDKVDEIETYALAIKLLKDDGIKAKIIKRYVPAINGLIAEYLAELEFFVGFQMDELFNETITSVDKGKFTYNNFSAGEKQRIDLAVVMAWRELAAMKNSIATNLIFMDEILDASMDGSGVELLLQVLAKRWSNANVFVISHRGESFVDRFDRVLEVRKYGNFSTLKATDSIREAA